MTFRQRTLISVPASLVRNPKINMALFLNTLGIKDSTHWSLFRILMTPNRAKSCVSPIILRTSLLDDPSDFRVPSPHVKRGVDKRYQYAEKSVNINKLYEVIVYALGLLMFLTSYTETFLIEITCVIPWHIAGLFVMDTRKRIGEESFL